MQKLLLLLTLFISVHCIAGDNFDCNSIQDKYINVKLKPFEKIPHFYVRSESYVLFFKEKYIKEYLSEHKNPAISDNFANKILANFPLKKNIDLYIDLISGSILLPAEYQLMIADLLEAGKAEVLPIGDVWGGTKSSLAEIRLFKVKDSISGSRYFCDSKNFPIFYIMDYIS